MDVGVKSQSKQKKSKIQGFMDKIEMLEINYRIQC